MSGENLKVKEHLIQLRVKSEMSLETLIKNFPSTVLIKNTEAAPLKTGSRLDVVYVEKVIKVADSI